MTEMKTVGCAHPQTVLTLRAMTCKVFVFALLLFVACQVIVEERK